MISLSKFIWQQIKIVVQYTLTWYCWAHYSQDRQIGLWLLVVTKRENLGSAILIGVFNNI